MLMTIVEVIQPMSTDLLAAVQPRCHSPACRDLQPTEISMIRLDGGADFQNDGTRAH
jgi:hypothetical protein